MAVTRRRFIRRAVGVAGLTAAAHVFVVPPSVPEGQKPRELKVRTWGGVWLSSLRRGVSEPFSQETGIPVTHVVIDDYLTGPKILEAIQNGAPPPVHVNWNTTVEVAKLAFMGATEDLDDIAGLDKLQPVSKPENLDNWPWVNTYSYVYALAYRDAAFPSGKPNSWDVMTDPRFRGRVGLFDDGNGFFSSAQVAGGGKMSQIPSDMSACWSFLERVKANRPLLGKDPDTTRWLEKGEVDACVTVTADARAARLKGANISWTIPQESAEYDTDAMCIPKGLSENERYWAKRYVEFAISQQGQQVWCNGLGLPPVYPGIAPPSDLVGDPAYPSTEAELKRFLKIPVEVSVQYQHSWYKRFRQMMAD